MLDEFKNSTIKYLYFGSSEKDLSEITDGKFLTTFFPIACCFAISINDIYGELNKRYYSINFGYDIWEKSESYLSKQEIPKQINIVNNAKDWIKTNGQSIGYIYTVEVTDYLKNHLEKNNDSDPKWEVIFKGRKHISIKSCKKVTLNWKCEYSPIKSRKYGPALVTPDKYDLPYPIEILKEKYPKLLNDPVHKWRAKTGIELIHKEPSFEEQKRIFFNWGLMKKKDQELSDKKSKELFKLNNYRNHNKIMEYDWHDENYFELNDLRIRYDKRDMEENGLKYIHISKNNKPMIMKPRISKHIFNDLPAKFKMFNENNTIPRICCSTSIFGAIAAIMIDEKAIYYVHLLEPKKVMNNREVMQYVPDAAGTGECWILDDEIKTTVIGKIEIGALLPYVYTFLKDENNFFCCNYHDYTFIPYESKFNRMYRKVLNKIND